MGAVEAKCGGCERGLLFRWGWYGGGEGTAGTSSQGSPRGTGFHGTRGSHTKNFCGSVVKRRGGQHNPLWRKTLPWGMASASSAHIRVITADKSGHQSRQELH